MQTPIVNSLSQKQCDEITNNAKMNFATQYTRHARTLLTSESCEAVGSLIQAYSECRLKSADSKETAQQKVADHATKVKALFGPNLGAEVIKQAYAMLDGELEKVRPSVKPESHGHHLF